MPKLLKKPTSLKKAIEYAEKSPDNSMEFECDGKKVKLTVINIPQKKPSSMETVKKTGWLDEFFGSWKDTRTPDEIIQDIRSARGNVKVNDITWDKK
ncbi:hypothetical protein HZA41_01135 [Candidatus Peregrinibacteria bacterium]|nr:hypothetical protein [Candidatus Peregrinibacteria bacterium]